MLDWIFLYISFVARLLEASSCTQALSFMGQVVTPCIAPDGLPNFREKVN